jgi:hypothetical protein
LAFKQINTFYCFNNHCIKRIRKCIFWSNQVIALNTKIQNILHGSGELSCYLQIGNNLQNADYYIKKNNTKKQNEDQHNNLLKEQSRPRKYQYMFNLLHFNIRMTINQWTRMLGPVFPYGIDMRGKSQFKKFAQLCVSSNGTTMINI